ncbi:MAG: YIP1 family protein [bacterium]
MNGENLSAGAIPETKPDSVGSMLVNIFLEPMKVFHRVQAKPSWVVPLIISVLILTASGMLVTPYQLEMQRQQIETNVDMQPEQRQQALDGMDLVAPYAHWFALSTIVIVPIIFFIAVGVLMLMGNVILGGEAPFKQVASIYAWTGIISALGMIVKTALILWRQTADIRLSLAILLPSGDTSSPLYGILNTVTDLFFIWQIVILILGLALIYKFSKGRAAAVVLIPVAVIGGIFTIISVAF